MVRELKESARIAEKIVLNQPNELSNKENNPKEIKSSSPKSQTNDQMVSNTKDKEINKSPKEHEKSDEKK